MNNRPTAVVTGSSTGLGLEVSIQLANEGFAVVGISRSETSDPRWRALETSGSVKWIAGDVSDASIVEKAVQVATDLGKYSVLVNCAGQGVFGAADSYGSGDIAKVLSGNLVGLMLCCSKSLRIFSATGGTIANVMSTAAHVGRANETIYCGAKWGARGYTEALRVELKGKPVRVLAVYPGGMKTPFWERATGHKVNPSQFMAADEVAAEIVSAIKGKRTLQVNDIVLNRL